MTSFKEYLISAVPQLNPLAVVFGATYNAGLLIFRRLASQRKIASNIQSDRCFIN